MADAKEDLYTAKIKKTIQESELLLQRLVKENATPEIDDGFNFEDLLKSAKEKVKKRQSTFSVGSYGGMRF
jgi:hypothetical protein